MNSLRCGAHFNIQTHGNEILDWIRVASPAMIVLLSRRKIKLINKTIGQQGHLGNQKNLLVAPTISSNCRDKPKDSLPARHPETQMAYGVGWLCFKSKMENFLKETKISHCVSGFNDTLTSATTLEVGITKPSNRCKPRMALHMRTKIVICNRLR